MSLAVVAWPLYLNIIIINGCQLQALQEGREVREGGTHDGGTVLLCEGTVASYAGNLKRNAQP